jgi:trigger factor
MEAQEEQKKQEWHHIITVDNLGDLKKKINITYDSVGVHNAMKDAIRAVAKQVQIKGYRKGKAPAPLVARFCKDQVDLTTKSLLSQRGFFHACNEHKLFLLGEPDIGDPKINEDGSFTCEITVEVRPDINPSGYIGLQLTKKVVERSGMVEDTLKDLRDRHATDTQIDEVQLDTMATVSFVANLVEDGSEISSSEDQPFMISAGQEAPFGENLVGMKIGESRVEKITLPKEFADHGEKEAEVSITLKSVISKTPATDEELVERMEAPSYEELVELLNKRAENEASMQETRALEEQAMDKLIEMHTFDVPEKWVSDEVKFLQNQVGLTEEPDDNTKKFMRDMGERNVRRTFILDAIYNEEPNLALTKEEIDQYLQEESVKKEVSSLVLKEDLLKHNMMDSVLASLKHRKIMNMILSQAQIEVENSEQEESQPEPDFVVPENPM